MEEFIAKYWTMFITIGSIIAMMAKEHSRTREFERRLSILETKTAQAYEKQMSMETKILLDLEKLSSKIDRISQFVDIKLNEHKNN